MVTLSVSSTEEVVILIRLASDQVLNRGLHLHLEVLQWSKLVEIWGTQNETNNNPQLNVCTSRADSYNASQVTIAREIEGSF